MIDVDRPGAVIDLVHRIDAVIGGECGLCRKPLGPDSASPDFCCEQHQINWTRGWPQVVFSAADLARLTETVQVVATALREAMISTAERLRPIVEAFAEAAAAIERPPPADPKTRALELRRNRNTGPAMHQRAPRRIDPGRKWR